MSEDICIKDKIIASALKNINFDGWSEKSILSGFEECNVDKSKYSDLFPNGKLDAILHFASYTDRLMLERYQKTKLALERVPEKIKFLLLARFEILNPNKEAVRKSLVIVSLPQNAKFAIKSLYETTDSIWRALGDKATDFSFYTKRGTLAGVYSSTLMSWLGSNDPDLNKLEEFLDRRLDNVKLIGQLSKPLKEKINFAFDQFGKFSFSNFNRS
tara:strand:- start:414 stop:1058 length:645 start_codon:yes stop_codon:yes gene_type:complete